MASGRQLESSSSNRLLEYLSLGHLYQIGCEWNKKILLHSVNRLGGFAVSKKYIHSRDSTGEFLTHLTANQSFAICHQIHT